MGRFKPVPHLAVPTGTSAGSVVAESPSTNPSLEQRRFGRIRTLGPSEQRASILGLIQEGVYAERRDCLLVVRRTSAGQRRHFVIASMTCSDDAEPLRTSQTPPSISASVEGRWIESPEPDLVAAVEQETRQRPLFHGVAGDGTTYSGFECADAAGLLVLLDASPAGAQLEVDPRGAILAIAIGGGENPAQPPLPEGLLIELLP